MERFSKRRIDEPRSFRMKQTASLVGLTIVLIVMVSLVRSGDRPAFTEHQRQDWAELRKISEHSPYMRNER